MPSVISFQPHIPNNISTHGLNNFKDNQTSRLFNPQFNPITDAPENQQNQVYRRGSQELEKYNSVKAEIIQQSELAREHNSMTVNLENSAHQSISNSKLNAQKNNDTVVTPLVAGKGGKHKDVYINKALGCGYVVGKSKTSYKDAIREQAIEKYTNSLNNPELSRRISTQKPITQQDIANDPALKLMLSKTGIDPKTVAKFELKNKHGVGYQDFHDYIKEVRANKKLSREQKTKISQVLMHHFISTLYYLGANNISNADLHGKNLKISFKSDSKFDSSQIEHLEVFDWGKSTNGDGFKFNQTLDFTLKEGDWMKKVQQKHMSSAELRSRRMVFADILSLATGSADSGYKEFKNGVFAKQANAVHHKLNQINQKYSNRDHSAAAMQKYKDAYLKALTMFASFADDRIDQLSVELPKQFAVSKYKDVYTTRVSGYMIMKSNGLGQSIRDQATEKDAILRNHPELSRRISTQAPITPADIAGDQSLRRLLMEKGIDKSRVFKYELKNKHGVEYMLFNDYMKLVKENKNLSVEKKANISKTLMHHFIPTLFHLGINKISDLGLHGMNLNISFKPGNKFDPSQIEHLEVIDWSKSSESGNFKFSQTLGYVFKNGGILEQIQQFLGFFNNEKHDKGIVFADILSLIAGNASLGYKKFNASDFAKEAKKIYNQLNQIDKKYNNGGYSMEQYQDVCLRKMTEFVSLVDSGIDEINVNISKKTNSIFSKISIGLTQIKNKLFNKTDSGAKINNSGKCDLA